MSSICLALIVCCAAEMKTQLDTALRGEGE